jgi:hypothetical protein
MSRSEYLSITTLYTTPWDWKTQYKNPESLESPRYSSSRKIPLRIFTYTLRAQEIMNSFWTVSRWNSKNRKTDWLCKSKMNSLCYRGRISMPSIQDNTDIYRADITKSKGTSCTVIYYAKPNLPFPSLPSHSLSWGILADCINSTQIPLKKGVFIFLLFCLCVILQRKIL